MLRLLLFLSALSWLKFAAAAEFEDTIYLLKCPLKYYGETHNKLYLKSTADRLIICLTGKYDAVDDQECIFAPPLPSDTKNVKEITAPKDEDQAIFKSNLASLPHDAEATCAIKFEGDSRGDYVLHFMMFEQQTALKYKTPEEGTIEFMVNDEIVDTVNSGDSFQYMDVSGCRSTGQLYKPNTDIIRRKNTCYAIICSSTAESKIIPCDAELDRCQSNGICILDPVCTVIGSSVIDINDVTGSVPNHCPHTLLTSSPITGFEVVGYFMDRRRKDMDEQELNLTSTPQMFVDVELSKTEAGVTARVSENGYTVTVFFDDYTAQISLTGEVGGGSMSGLCYNSKDTDTFRNSELSGEGCDAQHTETDDVDNNSNAVNDRCSLLESEPFNACSVHIKPSSFIKACVDTLGSYPAGDHLECHVFETYARICSERSGQTLEDWRSEVGCPSPRTLCQGRACNWNEFCAETISGDTGCFCRAIFASSYRSTDTWGDPMVCDQDSGSITLLGCFLEENGIDYSALQLKGENCEGKVDQETHEVTFSFNNSNTCGTEVKTNNSHMIFENAIINQESSTITRDETVEIKISCAYPLPEDQTMGFRIRDNSVTKQIATGAWSYQLTMNAYTDEHLTQVVSSSQEIDMNERIWVELSADGLGGGLTTLVTDSCWATNQESSDGDPRYDLFKNGCANTADPTVKVYENGLGASNHFSFNMFQFTGLSGDVYLHCKVNLCTKINGDCAPDCNQDRRRRRSPRFKYTDETSVFISLVWTQ